MKQLKGYIITKQRIEQEDGPISLRRFVLEREEDVSGTSGTGTVVEGVVFSDGSVVARWRTKTSSTIHYKSVKDMMDIHGHGDATKLKWLDT